MKDSTAEKLCGMCCATVICIGALWIDGVAAQTMAIGLASGLAGMSGYVVGRTRTLKRS